MKPAMPWAVLVLAAASATLTLAQGSIGTGAKHVELAALPTGWLVSAEEARAFQGEEGYNEPPALRPRALVPLIDILKPEPSADTKVKAPFAIAVRFVGQADAAIDPATFKVLYGGFKIDITSRITKYVNVGKEGFSLDNANIPVGKHRLTLQVQDEKQRVAERELRVEVE
ncbi:MAG: hypothetical protein NTU86_14910 [Burkholderiales bacterium]|nr:hypothetical protein [Burkholderiales bacterium]